MMVGECPLSLLIRWSAVRIRPEEPENMNIISLLHNFIDLISSRNSRRFTPNDRDRPKRPDTSDR